MVAKIVGDSRSHNTFFTVELKLGIRAIESSAGLYKYPHPVESMQIHFVP